MITPFIRQDSETKIALCRQGSCCPSIEQSEKGYTLTDDFGGSIALNRDEVRLLKQAGDHFEKEV